MKRRPPPISILIALTVATPVAAASAALVVLSNLTSRRVSEDLGSSWLQNAADSAAREVRSYLSTAVRVSDLFARRLEREADAGNAAALASAWEPAMLDQLVAAPDIASLCYAAANGDAYWLLRNHGRLEAGVSDAARGHTAVEYVLNSDGGHGQEIRRYTYEPRQRPWHQLALAAGKPVWTPVYFWFGDAGAESTTGTGYTRPVRDAAGGLRGVLVVDVTLSQLNDFLKTLPLASRGAIFILDDQGLLVAASDSAVNSGTGERLALAESASAAARAVAEAFGRAPTSAAALAADRAQIAGKPARVKVTALAPFPGINWRVITVLPEREFLAQAAGVQRRSVALALLAAAGSLALGIFLARRLSAPMLKLSDHVRRVGGGDFEARLTLTAARELEELAGSVNRMAAGLKDRVNLEKSLAVAMEVQQSLLPASDPVSDRLDIAGRTKYCDATGGDYFDFIEVSSARRGGLLIALGDVMGHGIAAALLMASARAALRAHAADESDLAALLCKVNRVLTRDARHGRFMTMSLAIIEPTERVGDDPRAGAASIRWCSAGHDPIITYHPATDAFEDLGGSGLPLGIEESAEYKGSRRDGLQPGCVLLIGTDGIWEMPGPQKQRFGKARLAEVVRANHARSAAEIAAALEASLAAFRGNTPVEDDVTFVVVKIKC